MIAAKESLLGIKMKREQRDPKDSKAKSKDLFLESIRRTEIVCFLLQNAENYQWPQPYVHTNLSKIDLDKKLINFKQEHLNI